MKTCPKFDIEHGTIMYKGTKVGSKAILVCSEGYTLIGSPSRRCLKNETWSFLESKCSKLVLDSFIIALNFSPTGMNSCKKLNLNNGTIVYNGTSSGSLARLVCSQGFTLVGRPLITCLKNGTWSGSEAICGEIVLYDALMLNLIAIIF